MIEANVIRAQEAGRADAGDEPFLGGARVICAEQGGYDMPRETMLFGRLGGALLRWHRRRQAYRALMALSDGTLKDIGIARGHIPALAETACNDDRAPGTRGSAMTPGAANANDNRSPRLHPARLRVV